MHNPARRLAWCTGRAGPAGSRSAAAVLVAVLVLLVSACAGRPDEPPPGTTTRPAAEVTTLPSRTGTPARTVVEREKPFLDTCARAREITTRFPTPRDVVVGPLSYAGFRYYRAHPIQDPNWGSGYFYKSGAQLRPGESVTVSILGAATKYAAILTESGPETGSRTVTYRSCTETGPTGYWWVGGFLLRSRNAACVPVKVTSTSEPTKHRAVISIGAGDCQ